MRKRIRQAAALLVVFCLVLLGGMTGTDAKIVHGSAFILKRTAGWTT